MTNIVDVSRIKRPGKPRLVKKILSSYSELNSSYFDTLFEQALEGIGYVTKLETCPLFVASLPPMESATHHMAFYTNHTGAVLTVDPSNEKRWTNFIQSMLICTCKISLASLNWMYILFSCYHDRIIIRLYRNEEEYQNHLVWRRILITPYGVIRGNQSIKEVWP